MHAVSEGVDSRSSSVSEVAKRAADVAAAALEETPKQLAVLAEAGVVDAGGRGLVVVLGALAKIALSEVAQNASTGSSSETCETDFPHLETDAVARAEVSPQFWEVMYRLENAPTSSIPSLKSALIRLGDSVTVAADGFGAHLIHVHCGDIGGAIEAGAELGKVRQIRVEPLFTPTPRISVTAKSGQAVVDRSVVVVVRDDALADLVRAEGVAVLVVPDDLDSSAAKEISERDFESRLAELIFDALSSHITVLPSDKELTALAERTMTDNPLFAEHDAVVVPCGSPVQTLSALAVHDASRRFGDDVVAMAEAAAATRRGEIRLAVEESLTWIGRAQAGDLLGLVDGEVSFIEPVAQLPSGLISMCVKVLARMLSAGGELVTILLGAGVPEVVGEALAEYAYAEHPEIEFVSYPSGQAGVVVLIGVE